MSKQLRKNEKKKVFIDLCTKIFLSCEGLIYITYLFIDLYTNGYEKLSVNLKYLSIFLCVLYIIIMIFSGSSNIKLESKIEKEISLRNYNSLLYLLSAFILTFLADYYLLLMNEKVLGVLYFVGVQIAYFLYLKSGFSVIPFYLELDGMIMKKNYRSFLLKFRKKNMIYIVIAGCFMLGVVILIMKHLGLTMGIFEVMLVVYVMLFIFNIVFSIKGIKTTRHIKLQKKRACWINMHRKYKNMLLGLILYFTCDVMVGIYNLDMYLAENTLPYIFVSIAEVGMWVFYLPGKVAISSTAYFILKDNIGS